MSSPETEKCPKCQWAFCKNCQNEDQSKMNWHSESECKVLTNCSECIYEAIFPMRLVNEALNETEIWLKLMNLQDHCEVRLHSPDWKIFHEKVRIFYSWTKSCTDW